MLRPMNYLIDGKIIAQRVLDDTAIKVAKLKQIGIQPKLAVVLVGNDLPSQTYVNRKRLAAEKAGIAFHLEHLPETTDKALIIRAINELQADKNLSGLIVQIPLPEPLYTAEVLNAIDPRVDVDCLTNENLGKLMMNTAPWLPPTPAAVMEILHTLNLEVTGKNVAIVGVGALVGKPLAIMMMNKRASVTTINSTTADIKEKCLRADIIVTGVGRVNIVRGDMVKPGAVVIDTGVSFTDGVMSGDVAVAEIVDHAFVTPTPGGVGPITVAKLLANTVAAAEKFHV